MRAHFLRGPASRLLFASLVALPVVACSLLNSLDEVRSDLALADSGANDAGDAGDAATGSASGVIVVGGSAVPDGGVPDGGNALGDHLLTALSPETGAELPKARKKMTVAAVQYDGIRDLWYVFELGGRLRIPLPNDPVSLHVMTLDAVTGQWETLQTIAVPTLIASTHVVVLRERVVYTAYRGSDPNLADLVTIDTANPTNISVAHRLPLEKKVIGMLASRGTQTPGTLNLLTTTDCSDDAGTCTNLSLTHVTIPRSSVAEFGDREEPLGPFVGSPAYGTFIARNSDLVAFKVPPTAGGNIGTEAPIQPYDPLTMKKSGSAFAFNPQDEYLKPMAIAECQGQALLIGTNTDHAVYSVPLTAAAGESRQDLAPTTHSGQSVYFEPYTSTVLATFSQAESYELTAIKLSGDSAKPTLKTRTDWNPPKDLRPELIATRTPFPQPCP